MATLLTFYYRVNGVLPEDDDTTVTSVTIGIVRDSDGIAVLPSGTATAHPSKGTYTYDPTALALSSSVAYTATWIYVDADGTHVATDTIEAADRSRSLAAYRANVQYELGRFITGVTSAASAGTSDLICADLIDAAGHATSYDGWFALLTSGVLRGAERSLARAGFTPATGALAVGRSFGGTPLSGTTFELSARLPATPTGGTRGVNYAINWALERTWFRDRISFETVAGQRFYSLIPWAHWFDRELRLGRLFSAAADDLSLPQPRRGGAWLVNDGELPMLEIEQPFQEGDTLGWVEVIRPAHTWIKSGGAWSESTVGLSDDDDQALVNPNLMTAMALVQCYQQLAVASTGPDRDAWLAQMTIQAAKAVKLRDAMLDKFPDGAAGRSGNRRNRPAYPSLVGF